MSLPLKSTFIPVLLVVILLWLPTAVWAVSGNIPLDSDVYQTLDLLVSRGLLRSHLAGTRPITWGEANRLLEEGREKVKEWENGDWTIPPEVRAAIRRLEKRIYDRFGRAAKAGIGSIYMMARNPAIEFEYLDGDPSSIPGIKASQHALVYNNGGLDPDEGTGAAFTMEAQAAAGPVLIQLFPRLSTTDEDRELIHRGSLKVGGLYGLELNIARESLWWGQGTHGGLYLTSNADPLPMVHLSTPHPTALPWIFRYLGPFRFEMFVSQLEEDRAVPEPYFIGIRSNFRPAYALEVGLTMMVMTGGEGRPSVSFGDLFDILFGENDISDDRSNKIAGLDLRLNLPGWQFYLEFAGEDEAGGAPSKMAGLAGFYFPRLTGNMDLRLEYVDFAYTEELAGVWYRHGTYSDGYTYEGRTLGHHAGGGGSRDLFTELTFDLGEKAKGSLGIDLEERGIHLQPEVERHTQLSAGLERIFTLAGIDTKIGLTVAVDQVDNWNYIPGEEATDGYVKMEIKSEI